ncbi:hypothetical protein HYN48_13785 [Flavobacterium magnum]|uniref:Uncharacterized protein n=1 Tax=Flavobacterium magnum TaxID=2162713 RepID=A0A2S0RIH6_9FLAO|nr:hypothetical protein HYN48_13785 [Flavobacterium magnum]
MIKRILKYLINLACSALMIWFAYLSYAIIVRVPTSGELMDLIWSQVNQLLPTYLISIVIISLLNYLFERKIEQRKQSYEFLILLLIQIVVMALATIYYSIDFYNFSMHNQS